MSAGASQHNNHQLHGYITEAKSKKTHHLQSLTDFPRREFGLAIHTGLRQGDLLRLCWSHVGDDAIKITTGKSKHRREAIIPLYDALRDVLASIPKRSTTILTNSLGRPWGLGFGSCFVLAKAKAGLADRNLHFHDLRGTAATRFYAADLPKRVIAEILAREEDHVEKIIRRYVDRTARTKAAPQNHVLTNKTRTPSHRSQLFEVPIRRLRLEVCSESSQF